MKLRFGSIFGVPVPESKPHQRLDILEHFMKGLLTLFGPLSGVLLWERCPELRIGYFLVLLWLACIGLQ